MLQRSWVVHSCLHHYQMYHLDQVYAISTQNARNGNILEDSVTKDESFLNTHSSRGHLYVPAMIVPSIAIWRSFVSGSMRLLLACLMDASFLSPSVPPVAFAPSGKSLSNNVTPCSPILVME